MKAHIDNFMPWLIGSIAGGVVAGAVLIGFGIVDIKHTQFENCRETEAVKTAMRETLVEADALTATSPIRSAQQKEIIVKFYADAVGRLRPRRC